MEIKRQTKIYINEGVMATGFIIGGATLIPFPLLSWFFLAFGIYGYVEVGRIVSNGNCKPFWEALYRKWKYGKR